MNNSKFKVIPNLSIRSEELLQRMGNRTIILNGIGGNYSLEEAYDRFRKMNKVDLVLESRKNESVINNLKKKLNVRSDNA